MKQISYEFAIEQINNTFGIELDGEEFCRPFFYNEDRDDLPPEESVFDFCLDSIHGRIKFLQSDNTFVTVNETGLFKMKSNKGHFYQMSLLVFAPMKTE